MARIKDQRAVPIVLIAVAVLLVGARIASQVMKPAVSSSTRVQWIDIREAEQLSRTSDKLVLLNFTAEWCAPCRLLDAQVFHNPQYAAKINESFIAVEVLDRQREEGTNAPNVSFLQKRYNVQGFPTLVFIDANGNERARMEGFRGRDEFERVMESALR